jgi:hypothetical protein
MKSNRNMPARHAGVAKARRAPQQPEDAIRRYVDLNNRHPKPFIWTKTADQILESLSRFCQRTSNSGHSLERPHGSVNP